MPQQKRALFENANFVELMLKADAATYDACLGALHNQIDQTLSQTAFASLTQLSTSMEAIILHASQLFSSEWQTPKVEMAARFAHVSVPPVLYSTGLIVS